jgi:4-amino-4-deoxy-L-arabinose transferase-like glycosyltransferase
VDKIFSIDRPKLYLILIFLLGFILRFIDAINLTVSSDDMHHVIHAINFISAERLITYDQSSGLWHAFTSVIYNLFGMSQLTSRFAALIFGSFSILVIYLLSKEFFSEKVSLIAAFLFAVSPFHVLYTVAEMDAMAMFFGMSSMLLFVRAMKNHKLLYYWISGVFLGLAIYTKVYPLLFVPSLLLYFVYFKLKRKENLITKNNAKKILIFLTAIFVFTIPALTHNYLLYKGKGFMDLQFTRTLGLGKEKSAQYYAWDHQFNAKNDWKGLILGNSENSASKTPTLILAIDYLRLGDPAGFYFGLIGIITILFYRKEYGKYLIFYLFSILFALPFLASVILLSKHYLFLELIIPISAFGIKELSGKVFKLFKKDITKIIIILMLILALILFGMPPIKNFYQPSYYHFYGKSHIAQMIEFKNDNIEKKDLIVGDSRIYRGQINWAFQGRPYLEGSDFINVINSQEQVPGNTIPVDVYYFECVLDDCGWGTVKNQPEFNKSMESLTDFFKEKGQLVKTIKQPIEKKPFYPLFSTSKEDVINVYKVTLNIKEAVLIVADQPKQWFLYDTGYKPKEKQFDYFEAHGFFDKLLNKLAHWIVLIAVVLAFISPFYTIYLVNKK